MKKLNFFHPFIESLIIGFTSIYQILNSKQCRFLFRIFFLFFFLLNCNFEAFGQKNAGKLIFRSDGVGLAYERILSSNHSFQVSLLRLGKSEFPDTTIDNQKPVYRRVSMGLSLEYRYYFAWNKSPLEGLFLSPNVSLQNNRLTFREITSSSSGVDWFWGSSYTITRYAEAEKQVTTLGAGIKLGYQKNLDDWTLDFGVSPFWNSVLGNADSVTLSNDSQMPLREDINGFTVLLHFGVGLAF